MSDEKNLISSQYLKTICDRFNEYNYIDPKHYANPNVKRGLRNSDGTGVCAGFTLIGNVHGYILDEGDKKPIEGRLTYRGYDVNEIVNACNEDNRYGFEEVAYLLLFGYLPNSDQLSEFVEVLGSCRELPSNFTEDMIIKAPSRDIMNKLARSVLAMYSYDDNPDDISLQNIMRQALLLIARFPTIVAHSYQVKKHAFDHQSMYLHFPRGNMHTAENILRTIRPDKKFTDSEAHLLDLALILHAEHGAGNNSSFASRVLASSGTDFYSCISAAVGSLKGPKHGGANLKVVEMMSYIKRDVKDWKNDDELASYLVKLINKQTGDKSGLIYGMGHAVYTQSDPRAVLLKQSACKLAIEKDMQDEFELISSVERLTPIVFGAERGVDKIMCANVDLYSGFVYEMLNIPSELFTPLFAISRIVGWSANVIEEMTTGGKIIRPAYKTVAKDQSFIPLNKR